MVLWWALIYDLCIDIIYLTTMHVQVTGSQKPRFAHSLTAISLGPGLTEVIEFGGSSDPSTGSDDRQPKIADTTLLQLSELQSIIHNVQLFNCINNT